MKKIGICDDEELYRRKVAECVGNIALRHGMGLQIIQYGSGSQVRDGEKPDILILDIEMNHMDGMQVRDMLEQTDNDVLIIFCTSHDEIMSEAYGKNVVGFIRKPIDEVELEKKLLHAINLIDKEVKWIILNVLDGLAKIKISDIVYGSAQGKYTKVYTLSGSEYFITDKGISQLYEMLKDKGFTRISRSLLVNMENVSTIGDKITMANGLQLKYSRRRKTQIQKEYLDYMCKIVKG